MRGGVSRRTLLRAARNLLPSIGLAAIGLPMATTKRAEAWFMVAMAAASVAIQVIQAFTQRPNGLAAMMQAINAKLDLILEQLANVEVALAKIADAIAELKAEIPEFVAEQLAKHDLAQLRGQFATWALFKIETRQAFLRMKEGDKTALKGAVINISNTVNTIFLNDHPTSAPIAAMAPIMLGSHINILSIVFPEQLADALRAHIQWHDRILSRDVEGSVAWWLEKLKADREAILQNIAATDYGKISGFTPDSFHEVKDSFGQMTDCKIIYMRYGSGAPRGEWYGPTAKAILVWQFSYLNSNGFPIVGIRTNLQQSTNGDGRLYRVPISFCSYPSSELVHWSSPSMSVLVKMAGWRKVLI